MRLHGYQHRYGPKFMRLHGHQHHYVLAHHYLWHSVSGIDLQTRSVTSVERDLFITKGLPVYGHTRTYTEEITPQYDQNNSNRKHFHSEYISNKMCLIIFMFI